MYKYIEREWLELFAEDRKADVVVADNGRSWGRVHFKMGDVEYQLNFMQITQIGNTKYFGWHKSELAPVKHLARVDDYWGSAFHLYGKGSRSQEVRQYAANLLKELLS